MKKPRTSPFGIVNAIDKLYWHAGREGSVIDGADVVSPWLA